MGRHAIGPGEASPAYEGSTRTARARRGAHLADRPRRLPMTPMHMAASMIVALLASIVVVGAGQQMFPALAAELGLADEPAPARPGRAPLGPPMTAPGPPTVWESLGANVGPGEQPAAFIQPDGDWGAIGQPCPGDDPFFTPYCTAIPPADQSVPAERTVYTLGNSHSVLFSNSLVDAIGRHPAWSLRAQAEPGCVFAWSASPATACERMWQVGTDFIYREQPDLVFVLGTRSAAADAPENQLAGLAGWIRMIESETDTEVVAVRDTPRFTINLGECLKSYPSTPGICARPVSATDVSAHAASLKDAGATWIDLNGVVCPGGACSPVQGGLQVYLDDNHVSGSYWRTLAPRISRAVHADVDWWPADPYRGPYDDRTGEAMRPVV